MSWRKNRGHLQVSGRLFSRIVKVVIHLQSPYFSNAFFNETHNSSGAWWGYTAFFRIIKKKKLTTDTSNWLKLITVTLNFTNSCMGCLHEAWRLSPCMRWYISLQWNISPERDLDRMINFTKASCLYENEFIPPRWDFSSTQMRSHYDGVLFCHVCSFTELSYLDRIAIYVNLGVLLLIIPWKSTIHLIELSSADVYISNSNFK